MRFRRTAALLALVAVTGCYAQRTDLSDLPDVHASGVRGNTRVVGHVRVEDRAWWWAGWNIHEADLAHPLQDERDGRSVYGATLSSEATWVDLGLFAGVYTVSVLGLAYAWSFAFTRNGAPTNPQAFALFPLAVVALPLVLPTSRTVALEGDLVGPPTGHNPRVRSAPMPTPSPSPTPQFNNEFQFLK